MFWDVDIKNGTVEYDDISFLPENFRSREYVDYLKEDMLQIKYPNDVLVDVGWCPSFEEVGRFNIVVVKDMNWDDPVANFFAKDVVGVKKALKKAIEEFT